MQSGIRRFVYHILVLFTLMLSSFSSFAQPPVEMPKAELQLDPKNLSPVQLSTLLSDKNRKTGRDINEKVNTDNVKVDQDSLNKDNVIINRYDPSKTYGADVFAGAAVTDLSELSTPPLDYPIGVGDHIIVALWGAAEFQESYIVARDGAIFPQGLGKINVAGMTFENARSIVYSRFKSVVPPSTNIAISIGQPRSININVVGEVNQPGIKTVSAFSNAFNVISKAGGVTEFGNLRNIQIKRAGVIIEELDVYKYLTTGDFGKHIYLQNNDFIIVGFVEKKVLATGQFKRPMYYQLKQNEGIKALLKYSGGFNSDAQTSNLKIIRSQDEKQVQRDINANAILKIEGQDFSLEDGDIVKVDLIKGGIVNKVEVMGEVSYPNVYELRKGDRLFDIINRAGGVTKNTYLNRAYVFRGAGDSTNLQADRLEIDLTGIDSSNFSSTSNVLLQANDLIQIFSKNEFNDEQFVEIFGEVRKEGKVRKYGGMTLQDLIYLSGGIKQSAEFGRLEISSIVDIDSAKKAIKPTRTIVKKYSIPSDLQLDSASASIILKPYDQVFVRRNPTFELQQNVTLSGLVKYPGLYPRLNKYERISSYIDRAGGIKENANLSGAILYRLKTDMQRESRVIPKKIDTTGLGSIADPDLLANDFMRDEPVSIDLYKALKYRNSKHDIVLHESDVIFIPEINPFVSVQGSVQAPLKIAFDKEHTNLRYYIDKAGGFGVRPWRKRIYVTYANGRSRRTQSFLFFNFYPRVEEGSKVFVPVKPKGQEVGEVAKSVMVAAVPVVLTAFILRYIN